MYFKVKFKGHCNNLLSGVLHRRDSTSIVVSAHGFGADKNYRVIKTLSDFLHNKKISSLRFDFSGVGSSEGDVKSSNIEQMVDDLNAAVGYAKKAGYKKIIVTGHSLGGMAAIIAAVMNKDVHALMLIAPAIDLRATIEKRKDTYKMAKDGMMIVAKTKVNSMFVKNIARSVQNKAKRIRIPVLIIHGDVDKSCDIINSKKFFKMLKPAKKMIIIKGANHHFSRATHLDKLLKGAHGWIRNL